MSNEQSRHYKTIQGLKPEGTEVLELTVGRALTEPKTGEELAKKLETELTSIAKGIGVSVPAIKIKSDAGMKDNDYSFRIRGAKAFENEMKDSHILASPGTISMRVAQAIKDNPAEIVTRDEIEELLEEMRETQPILVRDALSRVSFDTIQAVSLELLAEGVPLVDMTTVLETIIHMSKHTESTHAMVEVARSRLARLLAETFASKEDGKLHILTLDAKTEEELMDKVSGDINLYTLTIEIETLRALIFETKKTLEKNESSGKRGAVLVVPRELRKCLHEIYDRFGVEIPVLAQAEVDSKTDFEIDGQISLKG